LYAAFVGYPLRPWTEPCLHCCTDVEEEHALHRYGLRSIPAAVLQPYASHAATTWGNAEDFRHFLPRMYEVLVSGGFEHDWPDLTAMFSRLRYLGWNEWPPRERMAVTRYFEQLWSSFLAGDVHADRSPGSVICAVGQAVEDLSPYLSVWADAMTARGAALFAHVVLYERDAVSGELRDAWWSDRDQQREQVERWLQDPSTLAAVSSAGGGDDVALALQVLGR
jgi:hypothetical protein